MGYRSTVKIKMGTKAYDLLKENCLESDLDYVRKMVEDPDIFEKEENHVLIGWSYCKWYHSYKDVEMVEKTLRQLDDIIEDNSDNLDYFFYKKIELGEDGRVIEDTNDYDDEFVDDFYIVSDFSL